MLPGPILYISSPVFLAQLSHCGFSTCPIVTAFNNAWSSVNKILYQYFIMLQRTCFPVFSSPLRNRKASCPYFRKYTCIHVHSTFHCNVPTFSNTELRLPQETSCFSSAGMWRRVVYCVATYFLEDHTAYFFRVEKWTPQREVADLFATFLSKYQSKRCHIIGCHNFIQKLCVLLLL